MDAMTQLYMEETEELLQNAEECLIRLEAEYSCEDINELFRIAHTIKGSSHLAGYEDIGNLMHKIEDMLDCARNGSLLFDQSIVSLCFEGLDIVKRMLLYQKEPQPGEREEDLVRTASRIREAIEAHIGAHKKKEKEEKTATEPTLTGIVSSLLSREPKGKNKFYITFFIEEDAPMVSPVVIMILKSIEEIGSLVYSSVADSYFSGCADQEIGSFEVILSTDIEEGELYTYFALSYVDRINVVDLTRSRLEENDYSFNDRESASYMAVLGVFMKLYGLLFGPSGETKDGRDKPEALESLRREAESLFAPMNHQNKIGGFIRDFEELFSQIARIQEEGEQEELCGQIRTQIAKLMERANNYTKGRYIFRVFKPEKNDFIQRLRNFAGMVQSTLMILVDVSSLRILHEDEVKELIRIKRQTEARGIQMGIITEGPGARRILNIFDSIKPLEEFAVFKSDLEALLWLLGRQDFLPRAESPAEGLRQN